MSSIEERVKKIVVEQLGVKEEEVSPNSSFVDDLGVDYVEGDALHPAENIERMRSGTPLTDNRTWRKNAARFKQLDALARRVLAADKES